MVALTHLRRALLSSAAQRNSVQEHHMKHTVQRLQVQSGLGHR